MKLIEQSSEILCMTSSPLDLIEQAGRTCYQTGERTTLDSKFKFVQMLKDRGHDSVLEHVVITVKFITNRGVTHELVRHRLASFSQESTRYVRYGGEMEFIRPVWWDQSTPKEQAAFYSACEFAEMTYGRLLESGWRPEQAREVLPNALKTEIVVTANLREWHHIFKLRTSKQAHPQIRALMVSLLGRVQRAWVPIIFDDLEVGNE